MGQLTAALAYGVVINPDLLETDELDEFVLFDAAHSHWKNKIQSHDHDGEYPSDLYIPDYKHNRKGDRLLICFWIALGASGADGVPFLPEDPVPIGGIEKIYRKRIAECKKRWVRFAKWAKKEIDFGEPGIFLTETEVA